MKRETKEERRARVSARLAEWRRIRKEMSCMITMMAEATRVELSL